MIVAEVEWIAIDGRLVKEFDSATGAERNF